MIVWTWAVSIQFSAEGGGDHAHDPACVDRYRCDIVDSGGERCPQATSARCSGTRTGFASGAGRSASSRCNVASASRLRLAWVYAKSR